MGVESNSALAARVAPSASCGKPPDDAQPLSAEIVALLNEQAFSTEVQRSDQEVCEAFSEILLRHWDLCCISVFLRDDDGRLSRCADINHGHVDDDSAQRIGEALVSEVERTGAEFQTGTGASCANASGETEELCAMLVRAGLKAGAAVPILASGSLVGALAAASADAECMRAALGGIHCVGQAVVIALGNARRSAAMDEQHKRIESLVGELRQRTAALESANLELRRVNRYRSLFLQRMSHELRTPLTSILGFAEILIDQEDLTATQRRFCGKIQSSGFQLQASLNQLVDLSRLEAGQTELFLHEFSLRETLRESCAAVARLVQKQDVMLECTPAPEIGSIVSDEGKLRQVLYNFLAFAIGRSPAGAKVAVNVEHVGDGRLRIEINDEGEPLKDPARLFEPVDIDAPNERGTNMNELGLVIAHRLLIVLGGEVTLNDSQPAGLSVHLELPTRPTK
jgi:signal transduction histidine kinase